MAKKGFSKKGIVAIIVVALIVIVLSSCIVSVPTGHTGVVVTFGRVEAGVLSEGINFKLPWQNVVKMDNRAQKEVLTLQAFSSDIQQVDVICAVNYNVASSTAQDLFRSVGSDYYTTVMMPTILENVKAVFAKFTAENLVAQRDSLSIDISAGLTNELGAYGINILNISIEDIDFTDVFTDAVEAKQVAEQSKLQAQIEEEQKVMEAERAAERSVIAAEAKASVQKIEADAAAYAVEVAAKAEAEANAKIAQSLTPELLQYLYISQWDGVLPKIVSDLSTFMDVTSILEEEEAPQTQPQE